MDKPSIQTIDFPDVINFIANLPAGSTGAIGFTKDSNNQITFNASQGGGSGVTVTSGTYDRLVASLTLSNVDIYAVNYGTYTEAKIKIQCGTSADIPVAQQLLNLYGLPRYQGTFTLMSIATGSVAPTQQVNLLFQGLQTTNSVTTGAVIPAGTS